MAREVDNARYSRAGAETTTMPVVMDTNSTIPESIIEESNTEDYDKINENSFLAVHDAPLSTFSIDVDTASYSNVRRFLSSHRLPPKDSVRIEELVNYFTYDYPSPEGDTPFSVVAEVSACPWNDSHGLVHVGIQGKKMAREEIPPCNLVFLVDASGSMSAPNKLPLLKTSLGMLVNKMRNDDRIAVVLYAGTSGVALESTPVSERSYIAEAIRRIRAQGSTNAGEGINLAYQIAQENFIDGGVNRVILATDGDFNVGVTSQGELTRLIEQKRQTGISLSILGLGMGNLKDSMLEKLSNVGNGNYAYIDNLSEARKALVTELAGSLATIAKDVKIQVEFNPAYIKSYRLIGYENRLLRDEDFNDDSKDAGEIGAGHTVTALYEIAPMGNSFNTHKVDPLRYQSDRQLKHAAESEEILFLKIRYKRPQGETSELMTTPLHLPELRTIPSPDFQFSAAVATFGMLLRGSPESGNASFELVKSLATNATQYDPHGYRKEFLDLVEVAHSLTSMNGR